MKCMGAEASRALVNKKLKEAAVSKPWVFSDQHPGKNDVKRWSDRSIF